MAISIPIFTSQLEKSREATDAANLRAAYAEVMAAALTQDTDTASGVTITKDTTDTTKIVSITKFVERKQAQKDWQNTSIDDIGGVGTDSIGVTCTKKGWTVTWTATTNAVTFPESDS